VDSDPLLFELLRRFASTMARSFDANDVLYELCEGAVKILDATGAGVSVASEEGTLEFVTSTTQDVVELEHVQQRDQQGPCVSAFTTGEVVVVREIASLEQWPAYQDAARRAGFASVVGVPLALDGLKVGSLNVYDARLRDWSRTDLAAARVLADVATAYLVRAGQLAEERRLTQQLQQALDSRIVIEQAKGMVGRDHQISVDEAFDLMRQYSRANNRSLRDVATAVVEQGAAIPKRIG
jgi:GAF domain-containing protein